MISTILAALARGARRVGALPIALMLACCGAEDEPQAPVEPPRASTEPAAPVLAAVEAARFEKLNRSAPVLPADLEFLPGGSGESLLVLSSGAIIWLDPDFRIRGRFQVASANSDEAVAARVEAGSKYRYRGNEGLLGLSFDPGFASNRAFYVHLNAEQFHGVSVWRLRWTPGSLDSIWGRRELIFATAKPQIASGQAHLGNHNGGNPSFGPDGKLYIFLGDGGVGGINYDNNLSQDMNAYWGKGFRLDPWAAEGARKPRIFARGLRNPFTHSWVNGSILVGDVGRSLPFEWEEINLIRGADLASERSLNFGWPFFSGPCGPDVIRIHRAGGPLDCSEFRGPVHGYAIGSYDFIFQDPHGTPIVNKGDQINRTTIILGPRYRGMRYGEALDGAVLYSDLVQGFVRGVKFDSDFHVISDRHLFHQKYITAFAVGPDEEIFTISYARGGAASFTGWNA